MPKIVIIAIFTILVLGIVGGGAILVWQNYSKPDDEDLTTIEENDEDSPFAALPEAEKQNPELLSDNDDNDNDGLTNSEEIIWGTDSNNPDTDGDGYLDGEEVAANHDPKKPAPDDLLEAAKEPSAAGQPTFSDSELSIDRIEQYFADDLDLSGGTKDLKVEYENEYLAKDRSSATLQDFANEQPIIAHLPRPDQSLIPDTADNTPSIISQYLSVADNDNALANFDRYSQARHSLLSGSDPTQMLGIATTIKTYRNQLQSVPVPEVALPTHIMLLGYTELLIATFEQIALWNDEPAKSMIGTRQLKVIDKRYYPIIRNELQRLEALQ
jgi:hypothetical protein